MTDPIRRYSKASGFYRESKDDFFSQNDAKLALSRRQNQLYVRQPLRTSCKICDTRLGGPDLIQHGISYAFCARCGHLNGPHEDSAEFANALYVEDDDGYAVDYVTEDFRRRAREVYEPKVKFLIESLPQVDRETSIMDFGCGAGHFVYAALARGTRAMGVDVSRAAVDFGNEQIGRLLGYGPLAAVKEDGVYDVVRDLGSSVISAIGVLEHLPEPRRLLDAIRQSKADYLYFSVPMFSLSVLLENVFPEIYPRQLSGAHTHLFTEESLDWFYRHEHLTPIAEWRFGTDVMDFYRSLLVRLRQTRSSPSAISRLDAGLGRSVDALQGVLDRAPFCSEIHAVVRVASG